MSYSWISFDCYGTLIDWHAGIRSALAQVTPELCPNQIEDIADSYDQSERALEVADYQPYRLILRKALAEAFIHNSLSYPRPADLLVHALPTWRPFPEVPQVLQKLKTSGYRLAILSNVDRDLIEPSLAQLPVHFDVVVTAEDVGSYKPDSRHWEALLARVGVAPSNILHVAAGLYYDIPSAQRMGFSTCWINRHSASPGHIRPDMTLTNLTGLTDALRII